MSDFLQPLNRAADLRCKICYKPVGDIWTRDSYRALDAPRVEIQVDNLVRRRDPNPPRKPGALCEHRFIIDDAAEVEKWLKQSRMRERPTKVRLNPI